MNTGDTLNLPKGIFARCRSHAGLLAAALTATLLLGSCAGGEKTSDETPTTQPSVETVTSSPTPSPTLEGEPFELGDIPVPPDPMIPQAMLTFDEDGAKAFVRYAFDELTWMFATNVTENWRAIFDEGCEYCLAQIEEQLASNTRITGLVPTFVKWETYQDPAAPKSWVIGAHYRVPDHQIWDLDAMTVRSYTPDSEPSELYFIVSYDSVGWYIRHVFNERPTEFLGEGE